MGYEEEGSEIIQAGVGMREREAEAASVNAE